jgi:hypothetical protein
MYCFQPTQSHNISCSPFALLQRQQNPTSKQKKQQHIYRSVPEKIKFIRHNATFKGKI